MVLVVICCEDGELVTNMDCDVVVETEMVGVIVEYSVDVDGEGVTMGEAIEEEASIVEVPAL